MSVVIAGGAMTPFNRRKDGSSYREWCRDAFCGALAHAGVGAADVDTLVVSSESDFFTRQLNPATVLADTLGLLGRRLIRVEGGGASGHLAVQTAAALVASGQARRAAVLGFEASASHLDAASVGRLYAHSFDSWFEAAIGIGATSIYALSALAFMDDTGATTDDFAAIAVRNRRNALANPNAHLRLDLTQTDVVASPMISAPYRRLDCSPLSDGAACLVLARPEDLPQRTGLRVRIAGTGAANDHARLGDRRNPGHFAAKTTAAQQAFAAAGIGPGQIGLAEVYDSYTGAQMQALAALGLSEDVVREERAGQFTQGGRLPVNLSGGLLGQGAPVGATGVAQVLTAALQLSGSFAGLCPTRACRYALVDSHGGIATTCAVTILEAPA